jgi:hypothetical protein
MPSSCSKALITYSLGEWVGLISIVGVVVREVLTTVRYWVVWNSIIYDLLIIGLYIHEI